jgi:hypothetical protein
MLSNLVGSKVSTAIEPMMRKTIASVQRTEWRRHAILGTNIIIDGEASAVEAMQECQE